MGLGGSSVIGLLFRKRNVGEGWWKMGRKSKFRLLRVKGIE
jgi:hypothetical protein